MRKTDRHAASVKPDPFHGLSPAASRLLRAAEAALAGKQWETAERALVGVLAMAPSSVAALHLLGRAQRMRGDGALAIGTLEQASTLAPGNALVVMDLGIAQYEKGQVASALTSLQRACELAPELATIWFNRGRMLRLQGDLDAAAAALQRALQLDAAHVPARMLVAGIQGIQGDVAASAASYRYILHRHPAHAQAWLGLANLKTEAFDHADVLRLRQALKQPGLGDDARIALGFSLAKALEDQGDYDAAFQVLCKANDSKYRQMSWSPQENRAKVDEIIRAFAAPVPASADRSLGEKVIFVVSLPRSGSSLTEQILASHPDVEGGGELLDLQQVVDAESARRGKPFPHWVNEAGAGDWERLGRDYLARTAHLRQRRRMSVDKNLINWQLVGAAAAMLPGARIVNSSRDALETCFACYRQLFTRGNGFSYDFEAMVSYWHDYERLCRHWRERLPQRFFDHVHEALLADPEGEIRKLLAACRLDFNPACMEFHRTRREVHTASAAQVRQPLNTGTARSARYGDKLQRLRALIEAVGN